MMLFVIYLIMILSSLAVAKSEFALRSQVVVLMLLVSLLHPVLVEYPFGVSNFGNVWYAGVIAITTFLTIRHGIRFSLETMFTCLAWISMVWITMFALAASAPLIPGDPHEVRQAISLLTSASFPGAFPSWAAFFAASLSLAYTVEWLKGQHRITQFFAGCVVGQVVDSVIFFPLAFWHIENWVQVMIVGLVVKIVMSIPFVALLEIAA